MLAMLGETASCPPSSTAPRMDRLLSRAEAALMRARHGRVRPVWYDRRFEDVDMSTVNSFGARIPLPVGGRTVQIYSLRALQDAGFPEIARLPYSMKILLENLLRHEDGRFVKSADVETLARWDLKGSAPKEISFAPARVL